MRPALRLFRPAIGFALGLAACTGSIAAEPSITIERLLGDGWEIAGYTGTNDNRASLMLFRRKDKTYLVQCAVLYDVTRSQRTVINCYELH